LAAQVLGYKIKQDKLRSVEHGVLTNPFAIDLTKIC